MLLLLMLLPHKIWALLPLLLLLQPEPAAASLPVAPDLVSYVASLTLVINDFYDDKISGVEFDVDTLVCTDLGFETLSWSNDGPGVASVRVRGVSATCSGEYDWKYKTGLGTLRGDGELQAAVEGSNLVIQVEGDVGSGGLFETVTVVGCEANVALDGVELGGSSLPTGSIENFVPHIEDTMEEVACAIVVAQEHEAAVPLDEAVVAFLNDTTGGGAPMSVVPTTLAVDDDPSFVDWVALARGGAGPGSAAAAAAVDAAGYERGGDALWELFDAQRSQPFFDGTAATFRNLGALATSSAADLERAGVNVSVDLKELVVSPRGVAWADFAKSQFHLGATADGGAGVRFWLQLPREAVLDATASARVVFSAISGHAGVVAKSDDGLTTLSETTLSAPEVALTLNSSVSLVGLGLGATVHVGIRPKALRDFLADASLGDLLASGCVFSEVAAHPGAVATPVLTAAHVNATSLELFVDSVSAEANTLAHYVAAMLEGAVGFLSRADQPFALAKRLVDGLDRWPPGGPIYASDAGLGALADDVRAAADDATARVHDAADSGACPAPANGSSIWLDWNETSLADLAGRADGAERTVKASALTKDPLVVTAADVASVDVAAEDYVEGFDFLRSLAVNRAFARTGPPGALELTVRAEQKNDERSLPLLVDFAVAGAPVLVAGVALDIATSLGDAALDVNVTVAAASLRGAGVDAYVDADAYAALSLGDDLGLNGLFSPHGNDDDDVDDAAAAARELADRSACAVLSGLGGVGLRLAAAAADVRVDARSDVAGLGELVEAIYLAVRGYVGEHVDGANVLAEVVYEANGALRDELPARRDAACGPWADRWRVADEADARGPSPVEESLTEVDDAGALSARETQVVELLALLGLLLGVGVSAVGARGERYTRDARRRFVGRERNATLDGVWDAGVWKAGGGAADATKATARLCLEADVPAAAKLAILVLCVLTIVLFVLANVRESVTAVVKLVLTLERSSVRQWLTPAASYSFFGIIREVWRSGDAGGAVAATLLCFAFPVAEILLFLAAFACALRPAAREAILLTVESLSRWKLVFVFAIVVVVVAFHVVYELRLTGVGRDAPSGVRVEAWAAPLAGIYCYVGATLASMAANQLLLYAHRRAHGRDAAARGATPTRRAAVDALEAHYAAAARALLPDDPGRECFGPRALAAHPFKGYAPRRWQPVVAPLALASAALAAGALELDAVSLRVGGVAGWALGFDVSGESLERTYALIDFPLRLRRVEPVGDELIEFLAATTVFLAVLVPMVHGVVLAVLWAVPLGAKKQQVLAIVANALHGWAALDVFLVTLLAIWSQLPYVAEVADDAACGDLGAYFAAFLGRAFEGAGVDCVSLGVSVHRGVPLIALACGLHVLLTQLTARATNRGVAERVVARARALNRLLDAAEKDAAAAAAALPPEAAAALRAHVADAPDAAPRAGSLGASLFTRLHRKPAFLGKLFKARTLSSSTSVELQLSTPRDGARVV